MLLAWPLNLSMTTFSRNAGKTIGSILCVDDDDDDASLLEAAVNHLDHGISFIKCYDGRDALELLANSTSKPDLILLDVNMPLLNGFDCLREIRKTPGVKDIPVFMLSTSASPKDVATALEIGARKFLTKPNTYRQICEIMRDIIRECLAVKESEI
jgi:CheY-like chemotaxis protein